MAPIRWMQCLEKGTSPWRETMVQIKGTTVAAMTLSLQRLGLGACGGLNPRRAGRHREAHANLGHAARYQPGAAMCNV